MLQNKGHTNDIQEKSGNLIKQLGLRNCQQQARRLVRCCKSTETYNFLQKKAFVSIILRKKTVFI